MKGLEAVFEYTYQKQMTDFTYFSGMWQATDIQETTKTIPSKDYYIARHFFDTRNSFNAYATYKIDVAQDHHFSLMAGFSQEDYDYKYYNTQAEEQALIDIPSMGNAQGKVTVSDSYADFGIRSGFFRFNYDYKGKYILEVSGRYDGSSKFPKDSRFAFFPSFSMAGTSPKRTSCRAHASGSTSSSRASPTDRSATRLRPDTTTTSPRWAFRPNRPYGSTATMTPTT